MTPIKILFVTATKEPTEKSIYWYELANNYSEVINGKLVTVHIKAFLNNIKGLSEVYNEALDKYRQIYDYIVFAHNDLIFDSLYYFIKQIIVENHPVMGLAGAVHAPCYGKSPMAWNVIGGKSQAGEVWHKVNNETPFIKNIYAGVKKSSPALTVDGVVLIFSKRALDNPELKFDPQFTFDFYDMDICFTAAKLGLYCAIINAPVIHYSAGNGILAARYKELEVLFRQKWNVPNTITSLDYNSWLSLIRTNS